MPELYARLVDALHKSGSPFEIILVEDCGGDGSWKMIEQLASRNAPVRGFRPNWNYGQHNTLLRGIRQSRHNVIVAMDDDLEHPPDHNSSNLTK